MCVPRFTPCLIVAIRAGISVEHIFAESKVVQQVQHPGAKLEAADFAIKAESLFGEYFVL